MSSPTDAYQIRIGVDQLIPIGDALVRFVRLAVGGKRIHVSTAYRWALRGVAGLRLPTVRVGGKRYTSAEAFSWWAQALSDRVAGPDCLQAAEDPVVAETLRRARIRF